MLAGRRVVLTYRGQEVAEICPLRSEGGSFEERLERLEAAGIVLPPTGPWQKLGPLVQPSGALERFLDSRDSATAVPPARVETSCLVAVAFDEPGAQHIAPQRAGYDRLLSSNLLAAELRCALVGEEVTVGEGLLTGFARILPDRHLGAEIEPVDAVPGN